MTKVRRGGFIFVTWIGDHPPRHVHVYRDGEFIVKWDLEKHRPIDGNAPARVVELIRELQDEGRI